jgi:outer membrane biosynthesis protein TonB
MKKIQQFIKEKPVVAFVIGLVALNLLLGIGYAAYAFSTTRQTAIDDEPEVEEEVTPTRKKAKKTPPPVEDEDETEETPTPTSNDEEEDESPTATPSPSSSPTPTEGPKKNINLYGDIFADTNCNGTKDDGEPVITKSTPVNILKMPNKEQLTRINTNGQGHFSYSTSIDENSTLELQPEAVAPAGYSPNGSSSITFSKDKAGGQVLIPLVPDENKSNCSS